MDSRMMELEMLSQDPREEITLSQVVSQPTESAQSLVTGGVGTLVGDEVISVGSWVGTEVERVVGVEVWRIWYVLTMEKGVRLEVQSASRGTQWQFPSVVAWEKKSWLQSVL